MQIFSKIRLNFRLNALDLIIILNGSVMYYEAALTRKDICNMQIYAVLKDNTTLLPIFCHSIALDGISLGLD